MIFIDNKYTRWYYSIINAAKARTLQSDIYTERHHIIPKSLGGDNSTDNLAILTAREHFICHWLLTKMTTSNDKQRMSYALHAMCHLRPGQRYINARVYESNKKECAVLRSIARKGITMGEKNYNYGKKWSDTQRKRMSESRKGVPNGRAGTKHSQSSKEKMRESAMKRWTDEEKAKFSAIKISNKIVMSCPHCYKENIDKANFIRWHGDNCKAINT